MSVALEPASFVSTNRLVIPRVEHQKLRRLEYLDTLRGLAALSVIAFHYLQAYGPPPGDWIWTRTPLCIFCDGQLAVSVFFVLSGFVLSNRYFNSGNCDTLQTFKLRGYVVARCARLWIPYLAIFAIVALIPRAAFERTNTVPKNVCEKSIYPGRRR